MGSRLLKVKAKASGGMLPMEELRRSCLQSLRQFSMMHARVVKDEFKARSRAGMTIFLSAHQLSVAGELAERVGIISRGKLIALGTVEELRATSVAKGGLEDVFLSLVGAEERAREVRK